MKNAKFRLRNSIIDWLERIKLGWSPDVADSHGRNFVLLLTDVLWNLDGHHDTLKSRACAIPPIFSEFVGYNSPEKYKRKKRSPGTLSSSILQVHSNALLEVIQQPWLQAKKWKGILESLTSLAESLNKYFTYLSKKNTEVTENHKSLSPVREAAGNGASCESLVVIQKSKHVKPSIAAHHGLLQSKLSSSEEYTPICLTDFLPADPRYPSFIPAHFIM